MHDGEAPQTPQRADLQGTRSAVSIVLVSWNSADDLLRLLRALPLPGIDHEILVVDNDSSDGTPERIEAEFPGVRLIRNERNLGFAGGVNVGIRASRHPLVLLLNPDTRLGGEAVLRLVDHLDAHPEVGIVGPRVLNEDGSMQSSRFRFPSLLHLLLSATYLYKLFPDSPRWNRERYGGDEAGRAGPTEAVSGCCFLVRRALLDRVGLLDERFFMYAEETDLCYRARRAGWEVHYLPDACIVHVGGGSSRLARRRNFLEFRRSMLRFFLKHHGRVSAELARTLLLLFLLLRLPYWSLRAVWPGPGRDAGRGQLGNVVAGVAFLLTPLPRLLREPLGEGGTPSPPHETDADPGLR